MLPKPLDILRKFGKKPLTGADFMALCHANGITVRITRRCERGFYYCIRGKHFIALSSKLSSAERKLVAWHEFAHFLQNREEARTIAAWSNVEPNEASEKLADVFSLIATRPDIIKITGPIDFIKQVMRTKL